MRKIRCTLILAFAILVASCSNLITNTTSGISFSLDSSVVNSVQETIVRSGIIQGSDNVSVTCNISECLEGLKKIETSLDKIQNVKFSYDFVPYNTPFDIDINISYEGVPLYSGIKKNIVLKDDGSIPSIAVLLDKAKYTITYNETVGKDFPTEYAFGTNEIILPIPQKAEHDFLGWYDNPTFNGNAITKISSKDYGNKSFYASWKSNPSKVTHLVTFTTDYGQKVSPINKDDGSTFTPEELAKPTGVVGYTFDGWLLDGKPFVSEGYTITKPIELIAKWTIESYEIKYVTDNGTAPNPIKKEYNSTFSSAELEGPKDAVGVTFNKWLINGQTFDPLTYKITGPITLTASWVKNSYTIKYSSPYGAVPQEIQKPHGSNFTQDEIKELSQPGYKFNGWYDGKEIVDTSYTITSDITLTAQWSPIVYKITFDLKKGQYNVGESNPSEYNIATPTIVFKNPIRTGYDFGGWFDNQECLGNAVTELPKGSTEDKQYYAKWTPKNYTIDYVLNNGSFAPDVTYESSYNIESPLITLNEPERTGYTFGGWFEDQGCTGNAVTEIKTGTTENKKFYAKWDAVNYTIIYSSDIGTPPSSIQKAHGSSFTEAEIKAMSENGYTFDGWFIGKDKITTSYVITSGVTLTASWTPIEYNIHYVLNNGTVSGGTNPATYTITSSDITLTDPTREGYDFKTWCSDADLLKPITGSISQGSTGEKYFYAKWTPTNYTIEYILNNGSLAPEIDNPSSYNIESALITLPEPEKIGYTFGGWFEDQGCTGSAVTEIKTGTIGNKKFYAKWDIKSFTTSTFLWDYNGACYLSDNGAIPGNQITAITATDVYDFCFDNKGKVHVVSNKGYYNGSTEDTTIKTNKIVTCDPVTNTIYLAEINGATKDITNVVKIDGAKNTTITKPTDKVTGSQENFVVNNNVVYLARVSQNQINLRTYNIDSSNNTNNATSENSIKLNGPGANDKLEISDMIIHNNYIYMTIIDLTYYPLRQNSRGLILRVSLDNLATGESFGWTTTSKSVTGTDSSSISHTVSSYTPDLTSTESFFGPTRIIGVKGDKLEVIDEGQIISYTDNFYYENIDRIATINTTDFTKIESVKEVKNKSVRFYYYSTTGAKANNQSVSVSHKDEYAGL